VKFISTMWVLPACFARKNPLYLVFSESMRLN